MCDTVMYFNVKEVTKSKVDEANPGNTERKNKNKK